MKRTTRGFGLLLLAILGAGLARPAHAQAGTVKWADLVGTWKAVAPKLQGDSNGADPYRWSRPDYLTVRPDSTILWTVITPDRDFVFTRPGQSIPIEPRPFNGDTVARTGKARIELEDDALLIDIGGGHPIVLGFRERELSLTYPCFVANQWKAACTAQAYQRIDPSQRPLTLIATGVAFGSPVPTHPAVPTGTLTDLIGVWEGTQVEDEPSDFVRRLLVFRPDSTLFQVDFWKEGADTLAKGSAFPTRWADWTRLPGDTIKNRFSSTTTLLKKQQLEVYRNGKLIEVYKPIDRLR